MTQKLSCHHGHRFEAPERGGWHAICPLCGAVTSFYRAAGDTPGQGPLEPTVIQPAGLPDDEAQERWFGPTLDFEATNAPLQAEVQTVSLDKTIDISTPLHDVEPGRPADGTVTPDTRQRLESASPIHDGDVPRIEPKGDASRATQPPEREQDTLADTQRRGPVPRTVAITKTVRVDRSARAADASAVTECPPVTEPAPRASDLVPPPTVPPTLDGDLKPHGGADTIDPPPEARRKRKRRSLVKPPELPGYKVVNELGRGGMGVVYRARHERRNREVALKTLLHVSPTELQRFKQEFRSLADIAHPNLAVLYDLLSDGETWCFSMEILEAVDFTEYVWSGFQALQSQGKSNLVGIPPTDQPRLTAERRARLYDGLKQLTLGLNALHEHNILHRDIKPSNVLVTTEGRVVLVDFGLASQFEAGSDERPAGIQGTPEYMAPEQAGCTALSPASDWYAVGVMLYEILTGHFPITGTPLQILFKKQTDTPKAPFQWEPSISRELNDLCAALLDRNQEKRPTAADILRCVGAESLVDTLQPKARVGGGQAVELVGREGHLQGLRASFRQVVGGLTKTIFVHGRSGMGKSVLIHKFLEEIRRDNRAVVLSGRCYEQESVPFKALDNLIDSLADHLRRLPESEVRAATPDDLLPLIRLFPVLGQLPGATDLGRPAIENVDQQELRQRAMNALREMLKRIGAQQPLVLYVDDLQWGDEDSADLLADLVRPPDAPRVLILGSYRDEDRQASCCLNALEKAYTTGQHLPHREEIAVDSLQQADARRLALMLLQRDDPAGHGLADKIARESRGWPFFVWELAQYVQDTTELADHSLELDEVIWSRVHRLSPEARRLLELVAVTGRPIPAAEAYEAINAVEKGPSFLAQLRTRNLIRTTDAEDDEPLVETYHDRIRESVVSHLNDDAIRQYSLQLAGTFERASGLKAADLMDHIRGTSEFEEPGAPYAIDKHLWQRVFDLAYFYDAAGQPAQAFPFALCAAEQARRQDAQEVAEQQYRIALRGAGRQPYALRFRVHEGLGDVLVLRGRYQEAMAQFQMAGGLTQRKVALARLDAKLGAAAFKKGDMDVAGDYQEKALRAVGERIPASKLSLAYALSQESVKQMLHTYLPSRFVKRRESDSARGAMDLFRVRVLDELTLTYWFTQPINKVLWSHLRGMNLGELYPPSQELGRTYAFHAITMTGIPMAQRGTNYAEKAYQISVDKGDLWGQGKARAYHTFSCIVLARFHEGVRTGTEAVHLLEQAGDVWEANMARMIATVPMYHLGDLKAAAREARKAYDIGLETGDYSAVCISLLFWVPAAPHLVPRGAIQTELDRVRIDPLAITGAVYARGLELLLCERKPLEAAEVLDDCLVRAKNRGLRNVCVFSAATWKATALRQAAEQASDRAARQQLVKQARRAVRAALSITKLYRACRPHALREAGLVAALEGRSHQARRYFDQSLQIANNHGARYDRALTNLARGETGMKCGWENAEQEAAQARATIARIEDVEGD